MKVDIMYLTHNRKEFTEESFRTLIKNTEWLNVHELVVYDDHSTDGTVGVIYDRCFPYINWYIVPGKWGNPTNPLVHFLKRSTADILVKIDSDVMLPPGWLTTCLDLMYLNPDIMMVGLEPVLGYDHSPTVPRTLTPVDVIGGIGLFRKEAFADSLPTHTPGKRYNGLYDWQLSHPEITKAYITPGLPVFLLDRVPHPPWSEYSKTYIEKGWQRPWEQYPPDSDIWKWAWKEVGQ